MRQYALFALAAFTAVLLSSELALSLPVRGVGPDLLLMVLVAFSVGASPRQAALTGFAAGLFRDLLLTSPAGLSALAYALVAYGVSLVGVVRGVWGFVATVAGATFMAHLIYGIGSVIVSPGADLGPVPRVLVLVTLYDAVLAPLLHPLLRRLAPAEGAAGAES